MRSYPGNDHALDRLREIVGSGQAIAFVGAGASAGLYPLWGELIGWLIGEAERRGCPAETCGYWRRTASFDPQLVARGLKGWFTPRV